MDMREVASNWPGGGNPTASKNYDDSDLGSRVEWIDEERVRVRKYGKLIYTGKVDSGIRNLIEAANLEVPQNPHVLPVTEIRYFAVMQSTDERHSTMIGAFRNEKDAEAFAVKHPGWYGSRSTVVPQVLTLRG